MSRSPLVEAAADYLNRGLAVIALTGKTPNVAVHRTGLSNPIVGPVESESDWQLLEGVFDHADSTGVAIVIPYPYVVVDIDGEEGAVQWSELFGGEVEDWALHADLTWTAKTARGLHIWYSSLQPTGSIKLGSKLDLKGQGGYVAAPPSKHPDGAVYTWLVAPSAEAPPLEAPERLARRIADHAFDIERRIVGKAQRKTIRKPRYSEGDTVFYAQLGFDALLEAVKTADEGNRNNMLHWAAATMSEEGGIDEDFEELHKVALGIGLERVEVTRTIRSARRIHAE